MINLSTAREALAKLSAKDLFTSPGIAGGINKADHIDGFIYVDNDQKISFGLEVTSGKIDIRYGMFLKENSNFSTQEHHENSLTVEKALTEEMDNVRNAVVEFLDSRVQIGSDGIPEFEDIIH